MLYLIFLLYIRLMESKIDLFSDLERSRLEKINHHVKNINITEKMKNDNKHMIMCFEDFLPCPNKFEIIYRVINKYSYSNLNEISNFYVIKIRLNDSFDTLRIANEILYRNVLKLLKKYKKDGIKKIYELNPFFKIKICKKKVILSKYVNEIFKINYMVEYSQKNFYDFCIIIEENMSKLSMNNLFDYLNICSNIVENRLDNRKFAIMLLGNGEIFLEDDFNQLKSLISNAAAIIKFEFAYSNGERFEYTIKQQANYHIKENYNFKERKVNIVLCENTNNFYESKIDLTILFKEYYTYIYKLVYSRGNMISDYYRDNHYLQLLHFCEKTKCKYSLLIKADSTYNSIDINTTEITVLYYISYKFYKTQQYNISINAVEGFVEDKNSSKIKNFTHKWYLTRRNNKIFLKNRTGIENKNHEYYLKFLENINILLYIFNNDINYRKIYIEKSFKKLEYLFMTIEKSMILNKNDLKNTRFIDIINKCCKLQITDISFLSTKFFEFQFNSENVYDSWYVLDDSMQIFKKFIPLIEKHKLFLKEIRNYFAIEDVRHSLDNPTIPFDNNIFIHIKFSKELMLNIIIRKLVFFLYDIEKKEKYYTEKMYGIIFKNVLKEKKNVLYRIEKRILILIQAYKNFTWNAWNMLKLKINKYDDIEKIMSYFKTDIFDDFLKVRSNFTNLKRKIEEVYRYSNSNKVLISDRNYIYFLLRDYKRKVDFEIKLVITEIINSKKNCDYFLFSYYYTKI